MVQMCGDDKIQNPSVVMFINLFGTDLFETQEVTVSFWLRGSGFGHGFI
jgi:hypothetical protein